MVLLLGVKDIGKEKDWEQTTLGSSLIDNEGKIRLHNRCTDKYYAESSNKFM